MAVRVQVPLAALLKVGVGALTKMKSIDEHVAPD